MPVSQDEEVVADWARETPRKRVSIPYSYMEMLVWIKNNVFGPSKKYKALTNFITQQSELNAIKPAVKLGFIGDLMKMTQFDLQINPTVKEFFKDVDYVIGNFEGTISRAKRVFMAQEHSKAILTALETIFPPEKFVLGVANNHSGDFGWTEFNKSYQMLKTSGFQTIGRRDEPSILLDQHINVAACTFWTNQPCNYIVKFREIHDIYNSNADFNILFPHWGYEMQLYPNPWWINLGRLLLKRWDMIVGHHSHCPQPITAYNVNGVKKLLAYSLGNFCIGLQMKKYHHSIVAKVEVGPATDGKWQVGMVEWKFTQVDKIDPTTMEVKLVDMCKYFKDKL
ncbi:MAG TPA: CapA family protein [Candidatus Deferrimicrobium sp.]|nr:CapA family protein [Candidatus Deferrimicrobium sp.]